MKMRQLYTLFLLISFITANSQTTSISGKVMEAETQEPVLYGTVAIYKDGLLITGTDTDYDGNYFIGNLSAGKYMVVAKYLGMKDKEILIDLKEGLALTLVIELKERHAIYEYFSCGFQRMPIFDLDNTSTGQTFRLYNGFLRPNIGSGY